MIPKMDFVGRLIKKFGKEIFPVITGDTSPPQPLESPEIVFETLEDGRVRPRADLEGQYVAVPLLADAVAAGLPAQVDESQVQNWAIIYKDRDWIPHAPENYTCCFVRGRSMFPILDSGDIVAIDHAERPKSLADLHGLDGHICAFRVDGGVTIKWLKYVPEKEMVIGLPENKEEMGRRHHSHRQGNQRRHPRPWSAGGGLKGEILKLIRVKKKQLGGKLDRGREE